MFILFQDGCEFMLETPKPVANVEVNGLPESINTYLISEDNILPVRTFLESYYRKYDSENRASLINAYHVDAIFSIKFAQIPNYIPADKER